MLNKRLTRPARGLCESVFRLQITPAETADAFAICSPACNERRERSTARRSAASCRPTSAVSWRSAWMRTSNANRCTAKDGRGGAFKVGDTIMAVKV